MLRINFCLQGRAVIEKIGQHFAVAQSLHAAPADVHAGVVKPLIAPIDGKAIERARTDFTAMILQNFLDASIPENLMGSERGSAANGMWRSLLVEQLAKSVAESGQFNVFGDVANERLIASPEALVPKVKGE